MGYTSERDRMSLELFRLEPYAVLADLPSLKCRVEQLEAGTSGLSVTYAHSDVLSMFLAGEARVHAPLAGANGQIETVGSPGQVYIPEGTAHRVEAAGREPL